MLPWLLGIVKYLDKGATIGLVLYLKTMHRIELEYLQETKHTEEKATDEEK